MEPLKNTVTERRIWIRIDSLKGIPSLVGEHKNIRLVLDVTHLFDENQPRLSIVSLSKSKLKSSGSTLNSYLKRLTAWALSWLIL